MNRREQEIFEKIINRGRDIKSHIVDSDKVDYYRSHNFTVAIIRNDDNEILSIGVSKRSPRDTNNPAVGRIIAFTRAVSGNIGLIKKD